MLRFCLCQILLLAATSAAGRAQNTAAAVPTADPRTGSPVIAKVFDSPITEEQVLNGISQLAQQRQLPPDQMKQKDTLLFKDALDALIGMHLLKHEAEVEQMTVDKAKVEEFLQSLVKNFSSEADFKKVLELQGVTEAQLRSAIEDRVISEQVIDANVKDIPAVTEEEVKKYYDENPQLFQKPESVHAAEIVLHVEPGSTAEKRAETRLRLEGMRSDIENGKISFAEAATRHSDDRNTGPKGGDLGSRTREQMAKAIGDIAFAAPEGSVSPVFETEEGFHIIRVIEHAPAGKVALEDARKKIQEHLGSQARQIATERYLARLREKGKVEIFVSEDEWKRRHPGK